MKRQQPSFVVEHKRRPRAAKDQPKSLWTGKVGRELRDLLRTDAEPQGDGNESTNATIATSLSRAILADAPPKRILDARVQPNIEVTPEAEKENTGSKRRGRPRKTPLPDETTSRSKLDPTCEYRPIEVVEPIGKPPAPPAIQGSNGATTLSSKPSRRLGDRQLRRAARKALPLGERWRWNMRY